MTSMIKRVALAILDAGERCLSGAVYVDPMIAATAAIKAMREPTEGMMEAFFHPIFGSASASFFEVDDWPDCYRSMIDASLKDNA